MDRRPQPPRRASEGLNDPYSVAAIFHLALSRDDDKDPIVRATLNVLRSILDDRVFELSRLTEQTSAKASDVVTIDGRSWALPPRSLDRNWLIAAAMPRMIQLAGFTTRTIPSLILLPKFLPPSPVALATAIAESLATAAAHGLRDLEAIERVAKRGQANLQVTMRSKAPALARLLIAYPGLQASAVARLLGVTPQGARKLLAGLSGRSAPMLV